MPSQTELYSEWSKTRISTPPATTMNEVAVTITLAASRTDGGSRMNFVMRRSIRFPRRHGARLAAEGSVSGRRHLSAWRAPSS